MNTARLILDEPAHGAWNMAVDQALLSQTEATGQVTLRFYRWSRPTLSLGYFQKLADRDSHSPSLGCDIIRRASGGGAIMHDDELTYSLCIPSSNRWSTRNTDLYELVHQKIIQIVNLSKGDSECGARLYGKTPQKSQAGNYDNKSFLCFRRRTDGDIVFGDHKICGSAQRRLKNSLIQHGSLLVSRSAYAPELLGLSDLSDVAIGLEFVNDLAEQIGTKLGSAFETSQLSESELVSAAKFEKNQFGNNEWTSRR